MYNYVMRIFLNNTYILHKIKTKSKVLSVSPQRGGEVTTG